MAIGASWERRSPVRLDVEVSLEALNPEDLQSAPDCLHSCRVLVPEHRDFVDDGDLDVSWVVGCVLEVADHRTFGAAEEGEVIGGGSSVGREAGEGVPAFAYTLAVTSCACDHVDHVLGITTDGCRNFV